MDSSLLGQRGISRQIMASKDDHLPQDGHHPEAVGLIDEVAGQPLQYPGRIA
jgi:hypothetical protein